MQLEVNVGTQVLARINARIASEHEANRYRPTAVAIIQCPQREVFFVKSAKNGGRWGFLQGGIKEGETVVEALVRELWEEAKLDTPVMTINRFCHTRQFPVPNPPDGFTEGKSFYYFGIRCSSFPGVNLKADELSAYQWLPRPQADNLIFSPGRSPEKSRIMLYALQRALSD